MNCPLVLGARLILWANGEEFGKGWIWAELRWDRGGVAFPKGGAECFHLDLSGTVRALVHDGNWSICNANGIIMTL